MGQCVLSEVSRHGLPFSVNLFNKNRPIYTFIHIYIYLLNISSYLACVTYSMLLLSGIVVSVVRPIFRFNIKT